MTPNEYQLAAMATAPEHIFDHADDALDNAALGLCGEAGEFADVLKKHFYQGHPNEPKHLAKELGDILWYVAMGATALGYDFEEIMIMNIEKLKARYPEGYFDSERSQHREEGDI